MTRAFTPLWALLAAAMIVSPVRAQAPAQTPSPPAAEAFTVTPGQVSEAERAFRDRAVSNFQAVTRGESDRLAAIRTALPTVSRRNLGHTVTLSPRTPFAENTAWLNAELVTTNAGDNLFSMLVWADDFAPLGSFDVIIKAQPGKRYLVECSAQSFGASATQATVFASDTANVQGIQLQQARHNVQQRGSILSVVTPEGNSAPYLRVSLGIDPKAIDKGGLSVLVLDKCEVTPFS